MSGGRSAFVAACVCLMWAAGGMAAQDKSLVLHYTFDYPDTMGLPVENDILGDRWSHLAVVVEDLRCRFYRNGRLVRDEFGAKEAKKLFYWNNRDCVRLSPEKCYALLLRHPKNGVLAFISNLGSDAATVSVHFNLEKPGLAGKDLEAFNVLTKEPLRLSSNGKLSVPLESEHWLYVWLRPRGATAH